MTKKICSVALIAIMCLSLCPVYATASNNAEVIYTGDGYFITQSEITGKYDKISDYKNGLACVCNYIGEPMQYSKTNPGHYGFIDENGELQFPLVRGEAFGAFSEGYASFGTCFVDKSGNVTNMNTANHETISGIGEFSEGLAVVQMYGGHCGFTDVNGDMQILFSRNDYGVSDKFSEGLAVIKDEKTNRYGYIDKTGEVVIPCVYYRAHDFHNGLAVVDADVVKAGVIDKTGDFVIPAIYRTINDFTDEVTVASLRMDDGGGESTIYECVIDRRGNVIVPLKTYDYIAAYENGFARVYRTRKEGKDVYEDIGYIDTKGELAAIYASDRLIPIRDGYKGANGYRSRKEINGLIDICDEDSKWGLADTYGNVIMPCGYYDYFDHRGNLSIAKKGDKFYVVKINGTVKSVLDGTVYKKPAEPSGPEIKVFVNGKTVLFDAAPQLKNDRVAVPVRAIFESVGATVSWDDEAQTVTAQKDDTIVEIAIGSDQPRINGRRVKIDQPAYVENNRTYVPLRFVAEAFGANVEWDGDKNTVNIYT